MDLPEEFRSSIFSYDNLKEAKGLHVSLTGNNWIGREVREEDIPFYQKLFNTPEVMKTFEDGVTKPPRSVAMRVTKFWMQPFFMGQPKGSITILTSDTHTPIGFVLLKSGIGKGMCEIQAAGLPEFWGKGIGSEVLGQIVNTWAPEINRIANGKGFKESQYMALTSAFNNFNTYPLWGFEASSMLSNTRSIKLLDKFDFKPASDRLFHPDIKINLEGNILFESSEELETYLKSLYDPETNDKPLTLDDRYSLIDQDGKTRTFSYSNYSKRIQYHFERLLG